jgi:hypothetical protein
MSVTATAPLIAPTVTAPPDDYLFSSPKITPAQAVAELLRVCFPDARTALDATYGKGCFWNGTARVEVTGLDGNPKRARHVVGDFCALPFADGVFDVVIFDPPYLSNGGKRSIMRAQYTTYETADQAHASIAQGCREAWRVSRLGIIVKVQDHHHGRRFLRLSDWVRAAVPMAQYDELLAPNENPKVIDPKWKQPQLSVYRDHSAYLAFRTDGPVHRRRRPAPTPLRLPASPHCAICNGPLGNGRRDRASCSPSCRQRAYRQRRAEARS